MTKLYALQISLSNSLQLSYDYKIELTIIVKSNIDFKYSTVYSITLYTSPTNTKTIT